MALDTYSDLQTQIPIWAFRTGDTEFIAAVPDFIRLLETRVNRDLRTRDMKTSATVALTSGAGTLPADYLEMIEVKESTNGYRSIRPMPESYGTTEFPTAVSGCPDHYVISGDTITTVPAATGSLAITYYAKVPALSDASPTNWLLTKAPDVYLYGSLIEGATYTKDNEETARNSALYEEALAKLKRADRGSRYARATVRLTGNTP